MVANGLAEVDISRNAAVQLDTTPSEGPQEQISLWQLNLVGIRVQRFINWNMRRRGVAYIHGIQV
jgi:hypothetical protein